MDTTTERGPRKSCLETLIDVVSWVFMVLTVTINLADVTTDVIVAIQFWDDGRTTWFALVVTFLGIAHVTYMIIGAEVLADAPTWYPWADVPRPIRWLIMLFIAQLVPLINLIATEIRPPRAAADVSTYGDDDADENDTPPDLNALPRALREELEAGQGSRVLERSMRRAALEHFEKFGFFYVESAIEAAPQAIIQLLAISFIGTATPVQLVSLCLSLFSITSKFVMLARSYDARVMVFKFALAAHDVFSTFYLFSTIVAMETHKDTDFFGLQVSWLGYIWLWKVIATASILFIEATVMVIERFLHEASLNKCHLVWWYLAGLSLCGPLMLMYEGVKLIYLLPLVSTNEAYRAADSRARVTIFSFLERDDDDHRRLRHLAVELVDKLDYDGLLQEDLVSRDERHRGDILNAIKLGMVEEINKTRKQYAGDVTARTAAGFHHQLRRAALDMKEPFDLWKARRSFSEAFGTPQYEVTCETVAVTIWATVFWVVTAVSQGYSFVYPFVNAGLEKAHHNILQATCFYATCAAIVVLICFALPAYRYARFNYCLGSLLRSASPTTQQVLQMIASYHQPPTTEALQLHIDRSVLPTEVAGVVAQYIQATDVDMVEMTAQECEHVQSRIRDMTSFPFSEISGDAVSEPTRDEHDSALLRDLSLTKEWINRSKWQAIGLV